MAHTILLGHSKGQMNKLEDIINGEGGGSQGNEGHPEVGGGGRLEQRGHDGAQC